jgi:hypothetical protein
MLQVINISLAMITSGHGTYRLITNPYHWISCRSISFTSQSIPVIHFNITHPTTLKDNILTKELALLYAEGRLM